MQSPHEGGAAQGSGKESIVATFGAPLMPIGFERRSGVSMTARRRPVFSAGSAGAAWGPALTDGVGGGGGFGGFLAAAPLMARAMVRAAAITSGSEGLCEERTRSEIDLVPEVYEEAVDGVDGDRNLDELRLDLDFALGVW